MTEKLGVDADAVPLSARLKRGNSHNLGESHNVSSVFISFGGRACR
jgi:hypothetical protein